MRRQAEICDTDVVPRWRVASGLLGGLLAAIVSGLMLAWVARRMGNSWVHAHFLLGGYSKWPGIAIWLASGTGLGAVFSWLLGCHVPGAAGQPSGDRAFASGLIFGGALWVVTTFAVLPWARPAMDAWVDEHRWGWLLVHLVFGGALLGVVPLRLTLERGFGSRSRAEPQRQSQDSSRAA